MRTLKPVLATLAAGTVFGWTSVPADPITIGQIEQILPPEVSQNDQFGRRVDMHDGLMVAGSPQDSDAGASAGSAYLFMLDSERLWQQVRKIYASDAAAFDEFGRDVDLDGDVLIVGAPEGLFANTGQPRQDTNTGSAYLFRRNTGGPDNWGEIVKLTASDGQLGDDFGRAVAISGDTAVVGARFTDGSGPFSGSAYVYVRSPAEAELWIESRKLTSRNAGTNAYFGEDVAIEGPVIVAGAPGDLFGSGPAGAAYVFTSSVFGWNETEVLAGSTGEPGDRFGASVAISGNTIAVGAFGSDVDRVFVFERIPDTFDWAETAMLTTPCGAINSEFGQAIAIKDDLLVIGAPFDDEAAENAGAIFVYERNTGGPNQWGFVAKVISTDSSTLDQFGVTVAVSNDAVSTGAPGNDTAGTDGGSAYSAELYALDTDADGVSDTLDNCLATQNGPETVAETGPSQRDTDADGFGNMCDADLNNDCMIDFHDLGIMRIVFGATDENADFNGDGAVDFIDLGLMAGMFLSAPGPSATQSCDSSAVPPPQQHGELQIITSLNCEAP